MKKVSLWLILAVVLANNHSVSAGIIKILKGDKPQSQPQFQRVAFVGPAVVKEVTGRAERLAGLDRWEAVEKGAELQPGDIVRTHNGTVLLRMTESGSFIKMTPWTMLRLAPFEKGWDRGVLSGREEQEGYIVRSCRGDAQYREKNGDWKRVTVNAVLAEGSVVKMQTDTTIDLFGTREMRPVRLQGRTETALTASIFPGRSADSTTVAAVTR